MNIVRHVVVFDAADLASESAFWAGLLGGSVVADDADGWHSVLDADGEWRFGIQLAADHVPPEWPVGEQQQQVHVDFHVLDPQVAHDEVTALGARLLQSADSFEGEGYQVYASPAGHPFCIGWEH